MTVDHTFELLEEREIPELNTRARLYRHVKTGAEVLSLENADENKVFGVTFRTPPTDSTGVPHIMEHSVLCGSRKYPVKEPFVELMKGSLNTFLNAMTFSDKTCYPVASQNVKDFYNLVDVYLDAVFFPRLTREIFEQEGWHYELEALDQPLTYKGVVFNEMKGAYASPDSLIARYSEQSLFPDTVYRHDSGGDPEVIPELTYEAFRAFHARYYHPSNARIFFYGDDDPEARLRAVGEYLDAFEPLEVDSTIPLQPRLSQPRRLVFPYPVGEENTPRSMVTVNWLLTENADPTEVLALNVLAYSLIETPASPLRKALIDSGLGEDVIGGLDDSLRQVYFTAGLKGVDPERVDQVEALILDTLQRLSEEGIERATLEAALNTIEFRLREQNTGRYPRGLFVMLQALTNWLHDRDPLAPVAFERPLQAVKEAYAADADYFTRLLQVHLHENTHRATVILEPDPELQAQREAAEREKLAAVKAAMSREELETLIEHTRYLKKLQETPDPPEALATIPTLTLDDLDREPRHVPTAELAHHGTRVLYHDLFTNGILYLDLGFDLHRVPQDLLPYAGLFLDALLQLGTETEDFVQLTQRIGRKTGGISTATFISTVQGSGATAAWGFLRGKALMHQVDDLLAILRDVLTTVQLDNPARFKQIVLERKAREEASVIPMGHRVVASRLRAKFNEAYWVSEQIEGLDYLFHLRRLAQEIESDWPQVLARLEALRDLLLHRGALICNVTLDADNWQQVEPRLADFLATLPQRGGAEVRWTPQYDLEPEALVIPANVNYVGKGANLFELGYGRHGSAEVITHYLRSTWLWERVRVQGGAYGGFCLFDAHSGAFAFLSYRDPNLTRTLQIYDQTAEYLETLDLSQDELVKGIIGAIGTLDAYQLPDAKGFSAMARYLIHYTDEARRHYRHQVLGTTQEDFKRFAAVLRAVADHGYVVVMGPGAAVDAAEAEGAPTFRRTPVL